MLELVKSLVFHYLHLVMERESIYAVILKFLLIQLTIIIIFLLMIICLLSLLAMGTVMINHRTYYVYLSYISFFCSWFIFINAFSIKIMTFGVPCFIIMKLFLRTYLFFSLTYLLHFLIVARYFDFWVFNIIFTITLKVSLIARAFNLFSFWSDWWNSKWFFFIFLINNLDFLNFIITHKSIISLKIWFKFVFFILLTI